MKVLHRKLEKYNLKQQSADTNKNIILIGKQISRDISLSIMSDGFCLIRRSSKYLLTTKMPKTK